MLDSQSLAHLPEYLTYDDVLLLPNYSQVVPADVDVTSTMAGSIAVRVPIIASPMDTVCESRMAIAMHQLGGYGIIHRNFSIEDQVTELRVVLESGAQAGVAVGVGDDMLPRVAALVEAGAQEICLDSAHGHSRNILEALKKLRHDYPALILVAGNVATYEGAKALFDMGADAIKVGMGPGSICTTRIMSGMGVPQLTAVVEAARAAREFSGRRVIADGGIKTAGDITKALAAGADTVMLGSLLAGTDEAPGEVIQVDGSLFKSYRGMGSIAAMKKGSATRYGQDWQEGKTQKLVPEGIEGLVPHRGSLAQHIYQLVGGLKSGMGYLGASTIVELQVKASFIRVSPAALAESKPHSIITQ